MIKSKRNYSFPEEIVKAKLLNKHPYLEQLEKKDSVKSLANALGRISNDSVAVSAFGKYGIDIYYE